MRYLFHTTGKLGQSYLMETEDRTLVFEAQCIRVGFLRPSLFRWIRSATDEEKETIVSHTVTVREGGDPDDDLFRGIVARSSFKIGGDDVWEILRQKGLNLRPSQEGPHLNFNVFRGNERIIRLDSCSRGALPVPGYYRVMCDEAVAEEAFLVCFIVSRVEFR